MEAHFQQKKRLVLRVVLIISFFIIFPVFLTDIYTGNTVYHFTKLKGLNATISDCCLNPAASVRRVPVCSIASTRVTKFKVTRKHAANALEMRYFCPHHHQLMVLALNLGV